MWRDKQEVVVISETPTSFYHQDNSVSEGRFSIAYKTKTAGVLQSDSESEGSND